MQKCEKVGYITHKDAVAAIRGIAKREGQSMYHYKCDICGEFHISTTKKTKIKIRELKRQKHKLKPTDYIRPHEEEITKPKKKK